MSDMNNDFEQMLEASLVTIHNGEIVEGTVIDVKEDEIVLNIGYKADGIITRNEYSNQSGIDLRDVVKVDDVMNTICNATEERQTEAGTIARQSDAMLVIGGKHSSNTQKLYEICSKECPNTYFIQTLDDLNLELFQSFRSVGITAGASTPNNIIKEVQANVRHEQ